MKFAVLTSDIGLYDAISQRLSADGDCQRFDDAAQYLVAASRVPYAAVLVDAALGPLDLQGVLARRRGTRSAGALVIGFGTPSWMLDLSFRTGCDDVLPFPVDVAELQTRLALTLHRRASANAARGDEILEVGAYVLDRGRDTVAVNGIDVELTAREFALAWMMFSAPDVRVSRARIASSIWRSDETAAARSIEQHVYLLRNRLGLRGEHGLVLRAVYGGGYCLGARPRRLSRAAPRAQALPDVPRD
ncbi:MAG: response regulator transcription factor [Pandoraea sp.]|nr:response regulator transcription factor [Pandoraea sp.]MDR3399470.1 response regulator transcription factor [Pandoraea sp.]